jgi:PPK2 family polyphosphate:nucleotide phosphotransferase
MGRTTGPEASRGSRTPFGDALRAGPDLDLAAVDTRSTPAFRGGKRKAARLMAAGAGELDELQERLFAEAKFGGKRAVLLVLQGMDTSGKSGVIRHVAALFNPAGVRYHAFKAPTKEERAHGFLWRVRNALPMPGQVGIFDRSHYEDVLVVRVHDLVPRSVWSRRYRQINDFEARTSESGTAIVKVMLHISNEEQKARLMRRLLRPDKWWKYSPRDVDERALWPAYLEAYEAAMRRCSTDVAPWYVVPADRRWYARLAVQQLMLERLRQLDPQWPPPAFDVEQEKRRVAAS